MVIAGNEWLNNYEDEQKSASVNTTSTTTNTNNSPATSSTTTGSTTAAVDTVNTFRAPTAIPPTDIQTIPSTITVDNINNIANRNVEGTEPQQQHEAEQNQQQQAQSFIQTLQMMDDSFKIDLETNETENNNKSESSSSSATSKNNSPSAQSFSNTSLLTIAANSTTNVNINSLSSIPNQNLTTSSSPIFPNPNPITPQALSNALQSALNATSNNVTVSVNLPNSFLSSLSAVGISPNATLQHTANLAKQLSSSFCALDSQTHSSNSNLNTLDNNADISMREHQLPPADNNGQAKIILHCEPNSHPFQMRTILLTPNIECKVGRLIAKSKASESNAIFDCKVLSRNHAVLWYSSDGKFWVKDTKSSNGTFINESKLGTEACELHFGDVVKFGVDVMENSRKEVHGCIIAGVKLYLPDGRETISIESSNTQLSPHSGEGRISFDELHRLNLYMQEASQREKVLKSKLFNIQNILDATRKNSAICWQSMIAEDQLLHRIHSLEKKLQLMEKNVPDNVLRNEVLKLLDDKNSYQHSAKEALRKVYQERCDAMQMLSKVESAFATSDNECKLLRDQIMNTKQSLQDVNTRLLSLEAEYNEFKEQNERQLQEAKSATEQQAIELAEKLQQRELECEGLRSKISELLLKRADLLDEEQLQQQAIEKLDAAIADMDLGDDDDDDDEVDDDVIEHTTNKASTQQEGERKKSGTINGDCVTDAQSDSDNEKEKTSSSPKPTEGLHDDIKQTVGRKSTILKWLENSDLNKKEGSLDIFDAICNESDSSEGSDNGAGTKEAQDSNKNSFNNPERFAEKCLNFNNKLQSIQQNLAKLEAEIANESKNTASVIAAALGDISSAEVSEDNDEESDDDEEDEIEDEDDEHSEMLTKRNEKIADSSLSSKNNKSFTLLKTSVIMLREAYNEICENMKQPSIPPAIRVQTQLKKFAQNSTYSNNAAKKLATQLTLMPESVNEEHDEHVSSGDESSEATARISFSTLQKIEEAANAAIEETAAAVAYNSSREKHKQQQVETVIKLYQQQIDELQAKLDLNENDAQNTLEIMQIECDAFKDKVSDLTKRISTLSEEKQALEQVINENKSNVQKTAACCKGEPVVITDQLLPTSPESKSENEEDQAKEVIPEQIHAVGTAGISSVTDPKLQTLDLQIHEELSDINNVAVQREEELIMYKERLEETQCDNLRLRNEIAGMLLKADDHATTVMKRMLPYGAVVAAMIVYFIITYF